MLIGQPTDRTYIGLSFQSKKTGQQLAPWPSLSLSLSVYTYIRSTYPFAGLAMEAAAMIPDVIFAQSGIVIGRGVPPHALDHWMD